MLAAGTAALLLQANPGLTPPMVKAILQYTAQPLPGANLLQQGTGLLNVDGAVSVAKVLRTDIASAIAAGTITPRDAKLLDEAGEYIYGRDGKVVHPKAQISEDGASRGLNHGDRAIAAALAIRGIKSLNGLKPIVLPKKVSAADYATLRRAPDGSLGHRILAARDAERERRRASFEF